MPSGGGTEQLREGLEESFQSRILPQILDGVEERLASRFESRLRKLEERAERVEIIGQAVYELRQGQLKSHSALQLEVSLLLGHGVVHNRQLTMGLACSVEAGRGGEGSC